MEHSKNWQVIPIDPEQNLQQRLGDYLDHRLDEAERAEIERMIHDEDESKENGLQAQLDQMRYLRDSLKQLAAHDARHRLDAGFADRVLEASVTRAIDEGVSSDHPLIRVASQPGPISHAGSSNWKRRVWNRSTVAVVLSVAASIALAVFVTTRDWATKDSLNDQPILLAENNASDLAVPPPTESLIDRATADNNAKNNLITGAVASTEPAIAAGASDPIRSLAIQSPKIQPPAAHADDLARAELALAELALADQPSADRSVVAMTDGAASTKLAAIIVLEVRQTESGRAVGAVRRAMKQAGISRSNEKSLTAEIADAATQTVGIAGDEMVSLVYLQASAKSIDQFYVNLFDDREGVKSVALAIATSAPVLELVNAADVVDATTVASGMGSAIEIPGQIAPVTQLNFAEVSRESVQGMTLSSGPDFAAQLLIVIR